MNKIDEQRLPEEVEKLNGDSADKLKKCIDDLNEAVETVKEQRRNGK